MKKIEENRLPKIIFKQMPIKLETEMFLSFLDRGRWSKRITDIYPQFIQIQKIKSQAERARTIKNEILNIRASLGEETDKNLEIMETSWKKIENETLLTLKEIIQTDWPKGKEITAFVSINPVCPRFLDTWSFSVTAGSKYSNMIIAHEISHFLYFKKFKELFPDISEQKYDYPNKEWILSEIVATIILNDSRMSQIIGKGSGYYPDHKILAVNGKLVTKTLEELYKEFVIDRNDFSEFMREGLQMMRDVN